MKLDCHSLKAKLASFALINECDVMQDGSLRLATPLLYPDGAQIDIFYQASQDLFFSTRLTDLGQTVAFLADLQVYINTYEKREEIVQDVCDALAVHNNNGELYVLLDEKSDIADGILRLAQACVRVADLCYTHSLKSKSDFHQVFANFLDQERPDRIENFTIEGQYGQKIKTDFYTRQRQKPDNLIITLSSANKTSAHPEANDVFCRWYDLERYKKDYRFLTVLDSNSKSFLPADVNRIASVSEVLSYPAQATVLHQILAR